MKAKPGRALALPLLLAAAAFTAALAPVSPARAEVANPHGVAVIIGNRNYEHADVPPVDYAHRDAEAFKRYVVDALGFDPKNVIHLEDATRRRMVKVFGSPRARMNDVQARLNIIAPEGGSDVVVYYSGHGVPGREGGASLLPADIPPHEAETEGYPLALLYEKLGALRRAKTVRVFLDTCFSGSSDGGRLVAASPVYQEPAFPDSVTDNLLILTAVTGTQIATWDNEAGHGLFTHHLLDALYGKGDGDADGEVTAREAKAYLDRFMTANAWLLNEREQEAVLMTRALSGLALAKAGEDGAFPARPVLGEEVSAPASETEVTAPAEASASLANTPSPAPSVPAAETAEDALGLSFEERVLIQHGLSSLGEDIGRADGVFGRRTRAGILSYQKKKGLLETGHLTVELRDALVAHGEAHAANLAEEEDRRAAAAAAARASKPRWEVGKKFRDCADCPELVVVPAGSYEMGSPSWEEGRDDDEGPVHRVRIREPFAVGVHEVTFREWDACRRAGGCSHHPDDEGWGRGDRPVIDVSWNDAQEYVRWLSRKTGEDYRLLSESEWEYVARAGTTGPFHFGSTISPEKANYDGNYTYGSGRTGRYRRRTVPVGLFPSNAFGLHGVHGNVREWVEDCWHDSYRSAPSNGSSWTTGGDCGSRVLRGGSWFSRPVILRSAARDRDGSGYRDDVVGFRVARTLD